MPLSKEILNSHSVTALKKEIAKTNIKGYSKMKKAEVISLMMKPEHSTRFGHIKPHVKEKVVKEKVIKKKVVKEKVVKEKVNKDIKLKPITAEDISELGKGKKPKAKLGESGIGKKRKRITKPIKKKTINVEVPEPKKKVERYKPMSADCSNALIQANKIIRFYNKNKGVFSKDKYLIKNKVELEQKINNIKKILNDPKCKELDTDPPFKQTLEKALLLYTTKQKKIEPKKKVIPTITITEEEKPKKKVYKKGGKFFKPKEVKSKLPPIPKSNVKIRLPKKEEPKKEPKKEEPKKEKKEKKSSEPKTLSQIPSNLKKVWKEYVMERVGSFLEKYQLEELEGLVDTEKRFKDLEIKKKDKTLRAKEKFNILNDIGEIIENTKEDMEDEPRFDKIYKILSPKIYLRIKEDLKQKKKEKKQDEKDKANA